MTLKMRIWWNLFKKIQRLAWKEKIIFIKVGVNLIFFWSLLKILPFNKFLKIYKIMICNFKTANYDNIKIREIAYSIKKVSNHLAFKSTCLIQALTAKLM